jgi:hypothetical protein
MENNKNSVTKPSRSFALGARAGVVMGSAWVKQPTASKPQTTKQDQFTRYINPAIGGTLWVQFTPYRTETQMQLSPNGPVITQAWDANGTQLDLNAHQPGLIRQSTSFYLPAQLGSPSNVPEANHPPKNEVLQGSYHSQKSTSATVLAPAQTQSNQLQNPKPKQQNTSVETSPKATEKPILTVKTVAQALPDHIPQAARQDWASHIVQQMQRHQLPLTQDNVAFVLSQIDRESSFKTDPAIPNIHDIFTYGKQSMLNKIKVLGPAAKPLMAKAEALMDEWFERYGFDQVTTEGQLEKHWKAMAADKATLQADIEEQVPRLLRPLIKGFVAEQLEKLDASPVETIGAMQVDMDYAQGVMEDRGQLVDEATLRQQMYTKRRNLDIGIAKLADLRQLYFNAPGLTEDDQLKMSMADYQAGRYSSRNAAIQHAVSTLTGTPLVLDGDLLAYTDEDTPQITPSKTEKALQDWAKVHQPDLDSAAIRATLLKEKASALSEQPLVHALRQAYEQKTGHLLPFAQLPVGASITSENGKAKFGGQSIPSTQYVAGSWSRMEQYRQKLVGLIS